MKKVFAILLCFVIVGAVFAAGGRQQEPAGPKIYRFSETGDVATLNAHMNTSTVVSDVYAFVHTGLYLRVPGPDRRNPSSIVVPSIASDEPIRINDRTWHIPIRRDATFHNGSPINAHTFEYSYRMLLDPLLVNSMANFMFGGQIDIVNGQAYFQQNQPGRSPVAWSDVGIRAVNDYMLEIRTIQIWDAEDVKRHFLDRSLMPVYEPYYEAGMNAARTQTTYGATLDSLMLAGPFFFDTWVPDALRIYTRNYDHWMSRYYHFDRAEARITPDRNARVQLFENGEIDVLGLDAVTYDLFRDDPRTRLSYGITPQHIDINVRNPNNPILANVNFRRALYWAMDRETIARIAGDQQPSPYYVHYEAAVIIDGQTVFYRESPEGLANVNPNYGYDPVRARQYFDLAMQQQGQSFASVELFYSEASASTRVVAELLQQTLPTIFGANRFELTLRAVPAATFGAARDYVNQPTGHDMNFNGWGATASRTRPHRVFMYNIASYPEPMRPNSLLIPEFDRIFEEADTEESRMNPRRVLQLTGELERIYLDQVMQIPLWQGVAYTVYSERLITPFDQWIPLLGWGAIFADIRN